jgi:hypothetical protein
MILGDISSGRDPGTEIDTMLRPSFKNILRGDANLIIEVILQIYRGGFKDAH